MALPTADWSSSGGATTSNIATPGVWASLWLTGSQGGSGTTTVQPAAAIEAATTSISQSQLQCAAANDVLGVTYGRDRPGAQIVSVLDATGGWLIHAAWGEGEIDAIESIEFDDAALPAGVTCTHYAGTASQTVDSTLVAAWAAKSVTYADALLGVAYSVIRIPAGAVGNMPRINAVIRGRKLYDPRTGLTVWSDNPALALADFITSTVYGLGKTIDWASVIVVANACDAVMADGGKRRTLGLTLGKEVDGPTQVALLCTYAGCWTVESGGVVKLVADRPASSVATIDYADGSLGKINNIKRRSLAQTPNAVCIRYTDTTQTPWQEMPGTIAYAPGVFGGAVPMRLQSIALPGIHTASQAAREAIERCNKYTLQDLSFDVDAFDPEMAREVGDVITVNHAPLGIAKTMRVMSITGALGRYKLSCVEYDVGCYSDTTAVNPTSPDTTLPNAGKPPAISGLLLGEELFQFEDGAWKTRLRAYWPQPSWPYLSRAIVFVDDPTRTVFSGETLSSNITVLAGNYVGWNGPTLPAGTYCTWASPPVVEGTYYSLRISLVSSFGVPGSEASATWTAQGKLLLPTNVPWVTGFEVGGEVRLTIGAAADEDMTGYEVRWGPVGCPWALSLTTKLAAFINAAAGVGGYVIFKDAPAGTWDFLVCARDSIGQYSATPARITITVTLDVNSFLVDNHDFKAGTPTLTNMAEYSLPADANRYFVSEDGVGAAAKFPNVASTYPNIAATYNGLAATFATAENDFGLELSGNWNGTMNTAALSGTKTDVISLAPASHVYTDQSGLSAKALGRFAKLKSSCPAGSTLKVTMPSATLRIDAIPRTEQCSPASPVTSNASGPTTITLANAYAAAKAITITPLGTTAKSFTVDAIVVGTSTHFDVYLWNGTTQVAAQFLWKFDGV